MLHLWLLKWSDSFTFFNLFRYITFRSFLALFTSLTLFIVFGKLWIKWLRAKKLGQSIRDDGPNTHLSKAGTPTMGGVLVFITMMVSILLWGDLTSPMVWGAVGVATLLGFTGFWDDYRKIAKGNSKGLSGRYKLLLQAVTAGGVYWLLYNYLDTPMNLQVPFFKAFNPSLGVFTAVLVFLVIGGTSNAVNLTDGLDGLVSGPLIMAFFAYGIFAYAAGNTVISEYLQIHYVRGAGELAVVCAATVGGVMGFLWFNTYPAQIFLGDVGALSLGGLLGYVALATKQEILLVIVGGIFVVEALSVIAQVASFKLTGKRIFRMAPIHHHFELKGWPEPKVIVRFWIIAFILALLSLTTLKIR